MRILPASDPGALDEAIKVLRAGGVVVHATETCYGLACDLGNRDAVEKVFVLKTRPPSQPISALFSSVEASKQYVEWNEKAEELALEGLPGPLTLILPLRRDAPTQLYPRLEQSKESSAPGTWPLALGPSVGVRVSSHSLAQSLVTSFGSPLSTTSANRHGEKNPYTREQILGTWPEGGPDLFLDSGTLPEMPPSRVLDLTTGEEPTVRRR
jgi:L-threonylcarbamoyladenylate synthase